MENKLIDVLKDLLPNEQVDEKSSMENCAEWDSLKHIIVIMTLEEKFNVNIPIETAPDLNSYKKIIEFLKNNSINI